MLGVPQPGGQRPRADGDPVSHPRGPPDVVSAAQRGQPGSPGALLEPGGARRSVFSFFPNLEGVEY